MYLSEYIELLQAMNQNFKKIYNAEEIEFGHAEGIFEKLQDGTLVKRLRLVIPPNGKGNPYIEEVE